MEATANTMVSELIRTDAQCGGDQCIGGACRPAPVATDVRSCLVLPTDALLHEALRRFGAPLTRVRGRVRVLKGTFSGGTMASALATFEAIGREPGLTDRAAVDTIVKDLRTPGRGLRDMIHGIVASPAFQEN